MRAARPAAALALALAVAGAALTGVAAERTPGFGWDGYLSALGAVGAPWRDVYSAGVAGAGLAVGSVAVGLREVRAAAVLLVVSAVSFAGSAGVPCTPGCPLPGADGFPWNGPVTWADTVHAAVSATAFVALTGAMAVLATRPVDRVVRWGSGVAAVVLGAVMAAQLGWALLVASHGPVTGTTERVAALIAFAWTAGVAARLWWRPTACRTVEWQEGHAMRLEHRFSVPAGPDATWALLCNARAVESLVPGLSLERIERDEVTGAFGVDVGGRRVTYRGEAAFSGRDDGGRSLAIEVAGREASDGRPASATLTVALETDGAATTVVLLAELDVAGGGGAEADRAAVAEVVCRVVGDVAQGVAARLAPPPAAETDVPPEAPAADGVRPVPDEQAPPEVAAAPEAPAAQGAGRAPEADPVHAGAPGGPHRLHGSRHGVVAGDPVAAMDPVEPVDDVAPAATRPAPAAHRPEPAPVHRLRPRPAPGTPRVARAGWATSSPLAEDPGRRRAPASTRPPLRLVPPASPGVERAPTPWARRGALAVGVLLLLALLLWLVRRLRD
jgi:carbon monoxide dehydrogenase subunit G/hypothetical membrane protein